MSGAASLTVDGNAQIGNGGYGKFKEEFGATVDIKGSMTVGAVGGATGEVGIAGGSWTVGDGPDHGLCGDDHQRRKQPHDP